MLQLGEPPVQEQAAVGAAIFPDFADGSDAAADFFGEFADDGGGLGFARLDAAADEAPGAGGDDAGGAADQQIAVVTQDDDGDAFASVGGDGQGDYLEGADRSCRTRVGTVSRRVPAALRSRL